MDPVTLIVVPGFLGGFVLAAIVILRQRRGGTAPSVIVPGHASPVSTNMINMASIKVAGIGGLGLVAMAAAVALDVPQIGRSVAIGFVFGVIIAAVLIVRRQRTGAMPSSVGGFGANTTLGIDVPRAREGAAGTDPLELAQWSPVPHA